MVGILAEKPSAARNFAAALGTKGSMSGIYNGEQYVIASARGHLYEFVSPESQVKPALREQYHSWDIKNLPWNEKDFSWKYTKKKDTAQILQNIKQTLSKCDEIVVAGDLDNLGEGFLIQARIFEDLGLRPKKWSRMYFADESAKEIQKAFVNRKVIPDLYKHDEYLKADFRSKYDFITMQFTRVATKFGDGRSVLRQGRLKSAMVLIVGDRLKEVSEYKKIPYYVNKFKDENGVVYSNPDEPVYKDKKDVPNKYKKSPVVVDSKTMMSTAPPRLIDLARLSSMLAGKGYRAKTVLDTYQKMYESQIVSYPRTEDKCITIEQFNNLLPKVDSIARLVGVDTKLLTHRQPRKSHIKQGCAHGANRPGTKVPNSLDELKSYGPCAVEIYTILARSYLAMLAEDYEYENQKGHLQLYPDFKGSVNVPKKLGYKAVFSDDDGDDANMSNLGLGSIASPFVYEGFPPKPSVPTMLWLMKQLEKYDVGTGATRTSTYSEVTSDNTAYPLLTDKKGKIGMTQYGEMSYKLLPNTHIGSLKLTEEMYQDARDIASGKKNADDCIHKLQQMVVDDIETMKQNSIKMRKELNIMSDAKYEQKEKAEGVWNGKSIKFSRVWNNHRFTDDEVEALLAGETIEVFGFKNRDGKEYGVTGKLSNLKYNGHSYVGFERLGFANSLSVPDSWCGHDFTNDEKTLLEAGKSVHIDGAISKKNKVFSCDVRFGESDDGRMRIIPENFG